MIHLTTTCPDLDSARDLAGAAISARMAACANVTPGLLSLFHWQGAIEEETEVQITFKTTGENRAALVALITDLHPYDLPVITWEQVETTPETTTWLNEETGG
ncbi:MAG: divalent-cation tolerance protein CutA [Sediminimonas qiaohouensis]|uniref:Divalent-cation tolerance protein CutA n=1 Tax=Sediminimonas qiaohouensis TaxID=552061 RepID=A0A7C9M6N1_9RHOB|nr:divalent-cation tolerance protein CutA [Sediminimonas qiaohouensis]MTJ03141.1 divalent-cation tolerance protein CutA [Sediminimonas qiaohouensis]